MNVFYPLTAYHLYLSTQIRNNPSVWLIPSDMPFCDNIILGLKNVFPDDKVIKVNGHEKSSSKLKIFFHYYKLIQSLKFFLRTELNCVKNLWVFNDDRPDVRFLLDKINQRNTSSINIVEDGAHPYSDFCLKERPFFVKKITGFLLGINFRDIRKIGLLQPYDHYYFTFPDELNSSLNEINRKKMCKINFSPLKFEYFISIFDYTASNAGLSPEYYVLLPHISLIENDEKSFFKKVQELTKNSKDIIFKEHPRGKSLQNRYPNLKFAMRDLPVEYLIYKNPQKLSVLSASDSTFFSFRHMNIKAKIIPIPFGQNSMD